MGYGPDKGSPITDLYQGTGLLGPHYPGPTDQGPDPIQPLGDDDKSQ